jgi:hypothetical protein
MSTHLTEVATNLLGDVVRRFLATRKPTGGRHLMKEAKSTTIADQLVELGLLHTDDRIFYRPAALAFQYCGDPVIAQKAKRSVESLALAAKALFDLDQENTRVAKEDIEDQIRQIRGDIEPDEVWLGLYLGYEFNLIHGWVMNPEQTEIVAVQICDHVVEIESVQVIWEDFMRSRTASWGRKGKEFSRVLRADSEASVDDQEYQLNGSWNPLRPNSRKVFLVHGHDDGVKETVARFLEKLRLKVVILHEQPSKGQTVVEKFVEHSDVSFAVVLLTPDDIGASKSEGDKLRQRARQNVILELGYFIGRLGRQNVCPVYFDGVDLPSDFHGVLYVPFDQGDAWKLKLVQEIKAAGIEVDLDNAI